jgi:hypothetical protein
MNWRNLMRVTVKLDTFDLAGPNAFAVLWLDRVTQRWSREGHESLDLPAWGVVRELPQGLAICDTTGSRIIMMLGALGFEVCAPADVSEVQGPAGYFSTGSDASDTGHWRVQCIEREAIQAERDSFLEFDEVS